MKLHLLIIILMLLKVDLSAQPFPGIRVPLPGEEAELLDKLSNSTPGISQIEIYLELGSYYLFLPGEEKDDLSTATKYIIKAKELSIQYNNSECYIESLQLIANIHQENGEGQLAGPLLDSTLQLLNDPGIKEEIKGNYEKQVRHFVQLGKVYLMKRNFELSKKYFSEALKLSQLHKFPILHYLYDYLSVVEMWKDDWNQSLFYQLEAVKNMELSGDYSSAGQFYHNLGHILRTTGEIPKALKYFEEAFSFYKKKPSSILFPLCSYITEAMTKMEKPDEGIKWLKNTVKEFPPRTAFEKREIEYSLATCYRVQKKYDLAEVHLINLLKLQRSDRNNDLADINKLLGQLYIEWGKYVQAKPYLDKAFTTGSYTGRTLSHLYFMLFKADSAAGNHLLAINHIMNNKKIDEIIYKEAKMKESVALQVKYETEKKDQDLKIKEQNILLLKRLSQIQKNNLEQALLKFKFDSLSKEQNIKLLNAESAKKDQEIQLKQQNINLLAKQEELKEAELVQANAMKNVTIIGLFLLLIILLLLYNQYRLNQRSNREISNKNETLQNLVEEKEWLLKEVHHRVKNNLHTIISLLETQSATLKGDALLALQNSQHRVYAMSLIHQKLYQTDNTARINMSVYLPELLNYLNDSFGVKQQIQFKQSIKDIYLDVSKAIPVGLIINEAVTNSIKYAFPGGKRGVVTITIKRTTGKIIELEIQDNGIGLPVDWNENHTNSLGLKLIKGLTDDIRGKLSINSSNGTTINVQFEEDLFDQEVVQNNNQNIYVVS